MGHDDGVAVRPPARSLDAAVEAPAPRVLAAAVAPLAPRPASAPEDAARTARRDVDRDDPPRFALVLVPSVDASASPPTLEPDDATPSSAFVCLDIAVRCYTNGERTNTLQAAAGSLAASPAAG